jgi:hypothetical protein
VFYNTTGRFAVTPEWANNVSIMAEAAYTKLVLEDGFDRPARNPVPIYLDLARGGFTNFISCDSCTPTPGDLQRLQIEYRYKSPCPVSCGIPTSNWEVAHEVFATIEFTMFGGRLPFGTWLSESSANWAGYQVAGNESRWDPWVISAWLGPNGSTETPFLQRTFDNAFFLTFLSENYGGTEIVKRIMLNANLTNANEDFAGQLRALGYDKTLERVMDEFGAAMLTGNFTDRDGAAAVLGKLPPIGAGATWTGTNQSVSSYTTAVNGFRTGDPLEVRIPYRIEFVDVRPTSAATLSVGLRTENMSCFAAKVVTRQGGSSTSYPVSQSAPAILASPNKYDGIFVVVSRGTCSNGKFSVSLEAVRPESKGLLETLGSVVYGILLAIGLSVAVAMVWFLRRRSCLPRNRNSTVSPYKRYILETRRGGFACLGSVE